MKFLVALKKVDDKYKVLVPDLPGFSAAGLTIEEALENVKESIAFNLEGSNPILLSLFKDYYTGPVEAYKYMNSKKYEGSLFVFVEVEL